MLKPALLSPALFTPFWTHRKIPRFRNRPQNSQRLGAIDSNTLSHSIPMDAKCNDHCPCYTIKRARRKVHRR